MTRCDQLSRSTCLYEKGKISASLGIAFRDCLCECVVSLACFFPLLSESHSLLPSLLPSPREIGFPNRFPAGKAVGNRFPARGAVGEGSLEIGTLAVAVIPGSRFFRRGGGRRVCSGLRLLEGNRFPAGKAIPEGFPPGKSVSRGESDFGESDSWKAVEDLWVRGTGLNAGGFFLASLARGCCRCRVLFSA